MMSEDVRKNLRTQGKYSDDKSHRNRDKRHKVSPPTKEPTDKQFHKRYSDGNKGVINSPTDESVSPLQYEENSNYAFSQLEDVKKPVEIDGAGEFILSSTENGESKILCEPRFLHEQEAWEYFDRLYSTTDWYSKNIVIHGVEYPQPRLVAWYGPFPYSYSGTTLEAAEMPDAVLEIKQHIEKFLAAKDMNVTFNSVLLNLYRNGKDSVAWHSDDELTLGISPTIASVSLGETRKFEMRRKVKYHDDETPTDSTDDQYYVHLTHGSLVVMAGCMQDDWQHRIPKEFHDKEARINLTFRTVHPLEKTPEHAPAKDIRKEASPNYISSKTSCTAINLDVDNLENFPPLSSSNVNRNIPEKTPYPSSTLKTDKDISLSSSECWDSEISDDEHNVQNSVINNPRAYGSCSTANDNKYEDCIIENNRSSVRSHVNISENSPVDNTRENNLDKEEPPKKWSYTENSSVSVVESVSGNQGNSFVKKDPGRKFRSAEPYSSVDDTLEKNKEYPMKHHNDQANLCSNENQENHFKKGQPRFRNDEVNLPANGSRKNGDRKERPIRYRNAESNLLANDSSKHFGRKTSPKKFHTNEANSAINGFRKNNMDKKEGTTKYSHVEADSFLTQENNLNIKESPKSSCYIEGNSVANVTPENNLDKKVRTRGLNVEAKEFVPNNITPVKSIYAEFPLENLIYYKINIMPSDHLQDHAFSLKTKILEKLNDFNRFEREELEFLCKLTDGSQTDKNQKLISLRMMNIVINAVEKNRIYSTPRRSFDGNSRQRGNHTHYSDRGRIFQNQSRNNHRY